MVKFNEKAAQEWFFQKEGLPYGYHNFIYGWIDTPYDNFPATLSAELAPVVLSMLNNVIPAKVEKMWIQGLNKRLGTVALSLTEVVSEAAKRMMSI